jgi:hypothetical protein
MATLLQPMVDANGAAVTEQTIAVGPAASQEVLDGMMTDFAKPDAYPRGGPRSHVRHAYFSAKHLGAGRIY